MEFQGKVAIVTGGAQGIGRATALALAREGAAVVIADRDEAATTALVAGINAWGGRALAVIADVSDEADAARIANETVLAFGGIDLLVNNAGIQQPGTIESTTLQLWQEIINVNLTGVFLVSRFVMPELRRRGGGAIVNVASVYGLRAEAGWAAYAASKGGVIALTRAMALDGAPDGIRVNCVCPGLIDTSLLRANAALVNAQRPDEALRAFARRAPLGRLGTPEEVAGVILCLLSPTAGYLTGAVITVDGGMEARL
ncbi:SDR family NAD(P)-dependent oxidoreductase [uncultured Chloroflexus sp.]|uniref:SDR family NAD(P)-dependent oxidoreductase n=1 Tax=uncultured Chloroflexus sp. TaxID=214040 RepID=UPI00261C170B|nr:SDR family NAD(P)-dependent oxidoreductase [uncultured Chloroflexus sp.]